MKKIILCWALLLVLTSAMAQSYIMTYTSNAPRTGDALTVYNIAYMNPGPAGANKIWNFSALTYTSPARIDHIYSQPNNYLPGVGVYNTVSTEDGSEYYYNVTTARSEVKGYINTDISLVYTDPIIKMKYPFAYGNTFTDTYTGNALYKSYAEINFSGNYTVTADGFGKLYLPGRKIGNVLRVKVQVTNQETQPCEIYESNRTFYMWYAKGYRYPLLVLSSTVTVNEQGIQKTSTSGYYNPQTGTAKAEELAVDEIDNGKLAISTFPNPFYEDLNCSYLLKKSSDVTIELFDIAGKLKRVITKNKFQQEGMHTFDINAVSAGLVPGVYYLRFDVDKQVFVEKIVKI